MPIRALVVDDAVVMRRMIGAALATDADIEVVGVAAHGRIALQLVSQLAPDVITLDVEMPELDGVSTVRELRRSGCRTPVIMCSALTTTGAEATLDALAAGANDWIAKPTQSGSMAEGVARLAAELLPRIRVLVRSGAPAREPSSAPTPLVRPRVASARVAPTVAPGLLVIATSTGGPNALADLFQAIPRPLPIPVMIVQHMPPVFTKSLADRLGRDSAHRFHEAEAGQVLRAGEVYIAPGGRHMEVERVGAQMQVALHDGPPENSCRPAADVLLRSAARTMGPQLLACVLTGMGHDGLRGCEQVRASGGQVLAQDERTSVVWGMPGAVVNAGLAHEVLALGDLAGAIARRASPLPLSATG
ncbi:MAG: chemotaxis response regulator protein-glutamate methylesterase [Gemmatimonadetes bacterium]|nr:chemotaxis response regulator protein-glutamate methylesterase [Gemmatimonadota bacterium]